MDRNRAMRPKCPDMGDQRLHGGKSCSASTRLASSVTVTGLLPFDVRRCLSIVARGRAFGVHQMSTARFED
jgi:hypothetical protein